MFVSPSCPGTCFHCWSSETFFGLPVLLSWHERFWSLASNKAKLGEIRLSGGEPFLCRDLGEIIGIIRKNLISIVPVKIFTAGYRLVSLKTGNAGIEETVCNIRASGVVREKVEIHLSADEHHAGSLYRTNMGIKKRSVKPRHAGEMNLLGIPMLQTQTINFLRACEILSNEVQGFEGKLKIHAEMNRLEYHRREIFPWLTEDAWNAAVISSEGLIKAGGARNMPSSVEISPSSRHSIMIIPGAEIATAPNSKKSQAYLNPSGNKMIYANPCTNKENSNGFVIAGWWNMINRVFCGGTAQEALELVS
ncbi:MAG: hypothetical protein COY66_02495 [Candidatus Kerfeldbacteria bacterium CG_4_10_14_0_8_um_filter_42_10]|uniref:Radical SAM core domain-containing protein n=1 Tax=Candidatus Kerfeldbacteria bacterium CG_4_10_14_0_8_um_filter_42_10 TaxID=2014248 RepID=A0A2M7RKI0_9BACT|nr:MAG: hypothetical protein COY66_02495 [Candidatus Kerfeldbacteria bacterium CG_4_10_14_0_8_um_filter_42_10]